MKELTIAEYSEEYNLSRRTIERMIGDGRIPKENVILIPTKLGLNNKIFLKDKPPISKYTSSEK